MIRHVRQRIAHALDRRFHVLAEQGDATRADVSRLREEIEQLRAEVHGSRAAHQDLTDALEARLARGIRLLASDEPGSRRRLEAARSSSSYERAFVEREPLVSICIPTFDRIDLLLERSLPSVLEQTYPNIEVLVIGDAAAPDVEAAVRSIGDARLRYYNLTHRINHGSATANWQAGSCLARNLGYAEARGMWISDFDDDDVLHPQTIEHVVNHAQANRLEAVYGRLRIVSPDGVAAEIGMFPPALGQFSWQGGVVHASLRYFARELAAAHHNLPNDWERAERMMRAGVRFGMLGEVLADLYPSHLWGRAPSE